MADNLAIEPDLFYGKKVVENEDQTTDEIESDEEVNDSSVDEQQKPVEDSENQNDEDRDDESEDDTEESEVFEVDGVTFTVDQLKEYKQAYEDRKSMQADYTRKTQDIANKAKEQAKELYEKDSETLKELIATIQTEIETDDIDLDELKEYDEGEYYKQLHKKEKREQLIEKAKAELNSNVSNANLQAEQEKLIEANPQWLNDGKATQEYNDDMKLMESFYKDNGWTDSDIKSINTAKSYMLVIESAKAKVKAEQEQAYKAKAAKLLKPKSVKASKKPKGKDAEPKSLADIFYSNN